MTAHPLRTIRSLGRMVRSGEVSPVELAEESIARLASTGRDLNAVVTITADLALSQAQSAAEELSHGVDRGPLHGIPYGAKDLLAARGFPTTWGMAPFRDRIIDEDAAVITSLREVGAVLAGKLSMIEGAGGFGYEQANSSLTGPNLNARDPGAWAGGSSGGSGSAVGAGCVPFAIGTETWGSIHIPSAFNGLTGFRPTYGMVSKQGAMALSWTMDKIGPMCLTAEDCGLVMAAIASPEPGGGGPSWFEPPPPWEGPLRFAVMKGAGERAEPEVGDRFEESLKILGGMAELEEVELPEFPWVDLCRLIVPAEGASAFQDFLEEGMAAGLTAPEDRTGLMESLALPAVDYLRAMRIRKKGMRAMDELLAGFDGIVAPTIPTVAPPAGASFNAWFDTLTDPTLGAPGNLCGLPSISMPNGTGARGLPTSLEIMGRAWDDAKVIGMGMRYQQAAGWNPEVDQ